MDLVCVLLLFSVLGVCASPVTQDDCGEMPDYILEEILGPAFNSRYMSLTPPSPPGEQDENSKRGVDSDTQGFYVEENYEREVAGVPAWAVTNHVEADREASLRYKRHIDYTKEWHCKSRVRWADLGPDYFPRYLKSVECLSETCWFNFYRCTPKSFTIKILKRRRDRCTVSPYSNGERKWEKKRGSAGLPKELKHMWVWEERALTFCCDCAAH